MSEDVMSARPDFSRDAIRDAFLRDAEEATQQVVNVGELTAKFAAARDELMAVHKELTAAYEAASAVEYVAAKLGELGIADPATLTVDLPGRSRPRRAKRSRSAAKPSNRAASSKGGAAKPARDPAAMSEPPAQPAPAAL